MEVLERKENARASGIKVYVQKALTIQFEQEYRNLAKKDGTCTYLLVEREHVSCKCMENFLQWCYKMY